jgi:hypothetical protein
MQGAGARECPNSLETAALERVARRLRGERAAEPLLAPTTAQPASPVDRTRLNLNYENHD